MQFEVYRDSKNNLYIDYYVAVAFGVGDLLSTITIGDRTFIEISELEIETLKEISNETDTPYEPVYFYLSEKEENKKQDVQFEVYDENGTYFIDYYVAVAFGIGISRDVRHIGNREFVKVEEKDIANLIEISKLTDTHYVPVVFKLHNHPMRKDAIEVVDFEVYQKDDHYLVDYIVAVSFGVGNPANLQRIGSRTFVEINKKELDTIIDRSNETDTPYVPHLFNAVNTKQVAKLIVYRDEDDELYIASNAADVLGIKILCLENIKPRELHSHITLEDLDKIIKDGEAIGIEIEPEFVDFQKRREKKEEKKESKAKKNDLAILEAYKNIETGDMFLEDGICVFCDIGNRTSATFVNGKRCYSVNEAEVKTAAHLLSAVAVVKYFSLDKTEIKQENDNKEVLDVISAKSGLYVPESICNMYGISSTKEKVIDGNKYLRVHQKDVDKLRKNYTINYQELPQKTAKFIVCTLDNDVYIEEYLMNLFKFSSTGTKVRIEGKIYHPVTQEQIDKIISITSTLDTKLEPVYRGIKLRQEKKEEVEPVKDDRFSEDDYSDELIPGTNIFKPRNRKADESTEDYEYFLTKYYLAFFPNAKLPSKYRLKKEEINQDTNASRIK